MPRRVQNSTCSTGPVKGGVGDVDTQVGELLRDFYS